MDWFCIVGIWVLFGIICATVANNKGNNAVAAFFVGALLGPLGLILVLVDKPNDKELQQRAEESDQEKIMAGKLRKCPFCAEIIKAEAKVCKYCQRDLPLPEYIICPECGTLLQLSEKQQETRAFKCPKCKAEIKL